MLYLTPQQAADRLGLCRTTILRRIRDGSITASKLSAKTIRISEEALQRFVAANTAETHDT